MKYIIVLCLLTALATACSSPKKQVKKDTTVNHMENLTQVEKNVFSSDVKTIVNYAEETSTKQEKEALLNQFKDTVEVWKNTYSGMGFYKQENPQYSDYVLFNKKKTKAIFLVSCLLKNRKDGLVKAYRGKKQKNGAWKFSTGSFPTFSYEYNEALRKETLFTIKELEFRTLQKIADRGLVENGEINKKFLNVR